jgi:hypothetical protein
LIISEIVFVGKLILPRCDDSILLIFKTQTAPMGILSSPLTYLVRNLKAQWQVHSRFIGLGSSAMLGHVSPGPPICKTMVYVPLNLSSDHLIRSSKLLNLVKQIFGRLVIPIVGRYLSLYQTHIPRIEISYTHR